MLKDEESRGMICNLKEQVSFELIPAQYVIGFNGKPICARRAMKYKADFVYIRDGNEIVEDTKGFRTAEYKKKARLMKRVLGIEILES